MILDHVPPPAQLARARRALLDAGDDAGRRPLPRAAAHRADRERRASAPARRCRRSTRDGREIERFRVSQHPRLPRPRRASRSRCAEAGDIVSLAGMTQGDGRRHHRRPVAVSAAIPAQPIDPPTISVTFGINDSPARRPRRRQGAEPGHPRAADARGRDQRRDQGQPTPPAATPSRSPAAASCRWAC